ncbi:MAG TPA: quinone oxidoreductase [Alphaproteobacteria bacterium]|nr:quinone oxidoreductase [Alphaproteobacteria bacterium]
MSHAIVVHQPGGPEVLKWEQVPIDAPGQGQVKLRHTAVGLNYIDVYHRTGYYPMKTPFTPGMEAAGVVEAVGEGVTDLQAGDRVAYAMVIGGYAEERLVAADRLVKLPDPIDERTAAAMMLQGMTARYLVRDVFPIKGGETILVHAAAGGVGLILCQWAASLGATVIGTVSSEEKAALARTHGCHYPIIYTRDDFVTKLLEITGGKKLPVVFDSVGKDTFMKSLDCLRPRGLMVTYGQSSGAVPPLDLAILAQKGSLQVTRTGLATFIATEDRLRESAGDLFEMVGSGKIKITINQTYPLKDVAQAHRDLEARKTTGSTVLTV